MAGSSTMGGNMLDKGCVRVTVGVVGALLVVSSPILGINKFDWLGTCDLLPLARNRSELHNRANSVGSQQKSIVCLDMRGGCPIYDRRFRLDGGSD